ncbi:hypothetical protein [Citrobacter freundii]
MILVGLAIDQIAQSGLSSLSVIYYSAQLFSVTCTIMIKDIQAKYLYDVIVKSSYINKFVPTSAAKMTKLGNISQLKSGLAQGKYKAVVQNGKKYLIDITKKDTKYKTKRIIGVRESKKRKLVYDFYNEAEQGAIAIISGIQGHFKLKRG